VYHRLNSSSYDEVVPKGIRAFGLFADQQTCTLNGVRMNKKEEIYQGPSKEMLFDALRLGHCEGSYLEPIGRVAFSLWHKNTETDEVIFVKIEVLGQLRNDMGYKFAGRIVQPKDRSRKNWAPDGRYCQGHYRTYERKGWLEFIPEPFWLE
jgi:hypothetical protein